MNPSAAITAGLGFKPEHFDAALTCAADGMWYEVHAENYMVSGGPRLAMLDALRREHPLSVHGVGLSLAADADPDTLQLDRLAAVVDRYQPALISEHLAWSMWRGVYLPDLLPAPRTMESLRRIARNIDIVQQRLRRKILLENPSHYLPLEHELSEAEFLSELAKRTGCGLLVDVNNAYISAYNLGGNASDFLAALPGDAIGEIHLAGHARDTQQQDLLIDTHGSAIAEEVWRLHAELVARIGPQPTLIERDENLPAFDELLAERNRAVRQLQDAEISKQQEPRHVRVG